MKIQITLEIHPEAADPDHETGVSERSFDTLMDFLSGFGDDIDITKVSEYPVAMARESAGQISLEQVRDGVTFDHDRDYARLNAQHIRVYMVMKDERWRSLHDISLLTGDPEASISARLRDFRKFRFGSHTVERRHVERGLWEYRLIWNRDVPRPEGDGVEAALFGKRWIIEETKKVSQR